MKILQIADTHFGTENDEVCAALAQFVREQAPDLLLLCGDITQRATRAQFARARAFLDSLALPRRLIVPGNHDIPLFHLGLRLWAPYRRFASAFGAATEGEFTASDARVIALNTTRRWRHVDGQIGRAQIERVVQAFDGAPPGQWRIVVVHQPVAVTRPEDRHNLLHGAERALRRWAEAGVDIVLGGHIHLPYVLPLSEAWPDLPSSMWAVQAGTATSTRVRSGAPNSVNLLVLAGEARTRRAVVQRWDYDVGVRRFAAVAQQILSKH